MTVAVWSATVKGVRIAVVAGSKSKLHDQPCRQCQRSTRAGDSVLWASLSEVRYGNRLFVVHAACMAALVERAPVGRELGDPAAKIAQLRRRIVETGDPYGREATG